MVGIALWMVGVPIGNDADISRRAIEVLQTVDVIAAEDTRKAKRLLSLHGIRPEKLLSHGAHNEHASLRGIVNLLLSGKSVAYISDAGMPAISDPGFLLVRAAREAGVQVACAGGISAVTTALTLSGLPMERFFFAGFLPKQQKAQQALLQSLKALDAALVFYEAPHRILETLNTLLLAFGNRNCFVGRELTKIHEEQLSGTLQEVLECLQEREAILGEFTVVLEGGTAEVLSQQAIEDLIAEKLAEGLSPKEVRALLKSDVSLSGSALYSLIETVKRRQTNGE